MRMFSTFEFDDDIIRLVARKVLDDGIVFVRHLPSTPGNQCLLSICRSIGIHTNVAGRGSEGKGLIEDRVVHRVESLETALIDRHGKEVLSTTSQEFRLHTDEFFSNRPADVVGLHCIRQSLEGGESVFADVDEIVRSLHSEPICVLSQMQFPMGESFGPVLWREGARWCARYNPYELERHESGSLLTRAQIVALKAFEVRAVQSSVKLVLEKDECVFWRNPEILHGRTSFADRRRLLKRVRLHI